MLKGFFLTLPSVSINNTLIPVVDKLVSERYSITCYNTAKPAGINNLLFCAYPPYEGGYDSNCLDTDLSFYRFAEKMIDTAVSLVDFLMKEVERSKPDFIMHPHLAVWAKLVAAYYQLPAISLSSTFFMDQRIMQPWFRKLFAGNGDLSSVTPALSFYKKARALYKKLNLEASPDIWDTYVNKENCNISFILPSFQPQADLLGSCYKFAGFPMAPRKTSKKQGLVYVSLGTMLNNDVEFYTICIQALKETNIPCIISVGNKVDIGLLGEIPSTIRIERYVDQVEVLSKATLFITSGGMASIHEAIHTFTPVIVIPQTTEQHITAESVEQLGIGRQLPKKSLTAEILGNSLLQMTQSAALYLTNLQALLSKDEYIPAEQMALRYIDQYLHRAVPTIET